MTTVPEPRVQPTSYTVSCLPENGIDSHLWNITVDYAGHGRWAVRAGVRRCLSSDGRWDYESIPSERTDEWLAKHRFDQETALRLAVEHAPLVKVNGITVEQALARLAEGKRL